MSALEDRLRSADRDAHAAVSHHHRSDDEARPIGREEGDDLRDLFWLGGALDRRVFAVLGEESRAILHEVIEEVGHDVTNADGVDPDAMVDGLERLRARQLILTPRWAMSARRSGSRSPRSNLQKALLPAM